MTAVETSARSARFATAWRATGYRRLTAAVVASHDSRRLALTLERVAAVDLVHRVFDVPFEAQGDSVAARALAAAAGAGGLSGRVEVRTRVPAGRDSGADLSLATAHAAVDALLEASETPASPDLRRAVAAATGAVVPVPTEPGFGIHDETTGLFTDPFPDAPRFYLMVLHAPGSGTADVTGVGHLPDGVCPNGEEAAARWLTEANGPIRSPLAALVEEVCAEDVVLGAVGGHTEFDPVAFLLPGDVSSLGRVSELRTRVKAALAGVPGGFVVTVGRQGRVC